MNLDIMAKQGYGRGKGTLSMTEIRQNCRDFEGWNSMRIARKSFNLGVFLQAR
jgi:hypothetical protein